MIELSLLLSNPPGTVPLDLKEEVKVVRSKLRADQRSWLIKLRVSDDATVDVIEEAVRLAPHLLHFAGHGGPEVLYVEKGSQYGGATPTSHPLPKVALGRMLDALAPRTRVVVLNACKSALHALPILEAAECVIGMQAAISDPAALAFAGSFYGALGDGMNVGDAFEAGLAGLMAIKKSEVDRPLLQTRDGIAASDIRLLHKLRVFAVHSGSSQDGKLAEELTTCLMPLARLNLVSVGTNGSVPLNTSPSEYLNTQLDSADLLLVLVSRDLMNDEVLLDSIADVMRRRPKLAVVPIIIRACDFRVASFGHLQPLPRRGLINGTPNDRDIAWESVTQELKVLIARLQTERNQADHDRLMANSKVPTLVPQPTPPLAPQPAPPLNPQSASPAATSTPANPQPTAAARPPSGQRPTSASMRKTLMASCATTAELDALCLDHFPDVVKQFSDNMQMTSRINLLLQYFPPVEILAKLWEEPRFAKHATLLIFE